MDKEKIPLPCDSEHVPPDKSQEFLETWKSLFVALDPEIVSAYIQTERNFPSEYDWNIRVTKLRDAYDLDVQVLVQIKGELSHSYAGEIYCCPYNEAFAASWTYELDENLDSVTKTVTWEAIYQELAEDIRNLRRKIPKPPESNNVV